MPEEPISVQIVESPDISAVIDESFVFEINVTESASVEVTVEQIDEADITLTVANPPEITIETPPDETTEVTVESVPSILVQIMEAEESTGSSGWTTLKDSWTTAPSFLQSIAAGDVYEYRYGSTTYYRLVPSPYDSTLDQFFSSFSNPTLSGLLATRGVTI